MDSLGKSMAVFPILEVSWTNHRPSNFGQVLDAKMLMTICKQTMPACESMPEVAAQALRCGHGRGWFNSVGSLRSEAGPKCGRADGHEVTATLKTGCRF